MKKAKVALMAALVMAVLSSVRCVVALFFVARSLSHETNTAVPNTGEMQGTVQEQMRATLQHAQALVHVQAIHREQIALYAETAALMWNLLIAGLLIFAVSRFQRSI
jgi:hypothetical protein